MVERMITRTFVESVATYAVMRAGKWCDDATITLRGKLTRADVMNYVLEQDAEAETVVVKNLDVTYTVYGMTMDAFKAAAVVVDRPASQMPKAVREKKANTQTSKKSK